MVLGDRYERGHWLLRGSRVLVGRGWGIAPSLLCLPFLLDTMRQEPFSLPPAPHHDALFGLGPKAAGPDDHRLEPWSKQTCSPFKVHLRCFVLTKADKHISLLSHPNHAFSPCPLVSFCLDGVLQKFPGCSIKLLRQRKTDNQAKYVRKSSSKTILVGKKDEADSSEMKGEGVWSLGRAKGRILEGIDGVVEKSVSISISYLVLRSQFPKVPQRWVNSVPSGIVIMLKG